ncbi:MAG: serine kinase [Bacteroidales bacterium]|nr:serine kinase [Bacteroidales bacterium]
MKVRDIQEKLQLQLFSGGSGLDNEITGGYVSDLLSDVMGNSDSGEAWVTLQTHKNIMAIASLKELSCIIIVKGFKPEQETIDKSDEDGIPILGSDKSTFEISGELYQLIKK